MVNWGGNLDIDDSNKQKDFPELDAWKLSFKVMNETYFFCKTLPTSEKYNFDIQLRKSSSSAPTNIAKGYGRYYFQDNICSCRIARGSLYETKSHLLACQSIEIGDIKMIPSILEKISEVAKSLNGYLRYLNKIKPGK